ncbi:MAG: hemerythrin domain-containing protein [Pseudomonadales bacterium]|nr:hemerythrin domain-containing protein [Pseudomonadales bacterium]
MKRSQALIPLSLDHQVSLMLAKQCKNLATASRAEKIQFFSDTQIQFEDLIYQHFYLEESTLFTLQIDVSFSQLCQLLKQEHRQMIVDYEGLLQGNFSNIQAFGQMLYDHTRKEERLLFPMLEKACTPTQLETLMNSGSN